MQKRPFVYPGTSRAAWGGDFTLDYNFQANFWGAASSNHPELILPCVFIQNMPMFCLWVVDEKQKHHHLPRQARAKHNQPLVCACRYVDTILRLLPLGQARAQAPDWHTGRGFFGPAGTRDSNWVVAPL